MPPLADIDARERDAAGSVLMEAERQYRRELPGAPPPLEIESARWAAVAFFRACQFVVFRDLGEDQIDQALQLDCPAGDSPETHYSVDLTFRYLPDLLRLASRPSEGDPLVHRLRGWAARWPLSSVGIANVGPTSVGAIVGHPGLLSLYADRVLARCDASRLRNPRVRECVRELLGAFHELAPSLAAALEPDDDAKRS